MYKIAICEDDSYHANKIRKMLEDLLAERKILHKIEIYESGEDLCYEPAQIKEYDMIFLDVKMKKLDGIETAKVIRSVNKEVALTFISEFLEYALSGYLFETTRYILKRDLEVAFPECLDAMLTRLSRRAKMISIKCIDGIRDIPIALIVYVRSSERKLLLYMMEKKLTELQAYGKLDELEKQLESYGFIRIHRGYLVNVVYIEELRDYTVRLKPKVGYGKGDLGGLPVPRERYREIRKYYFKVRGELK